MKPAREDDCGAWFDICNCDFIKTCLLSLLTHYSEYEKERSSLDGRTKSNEKSSSNVNGKELMIVGDIAGKKFPESSELRHSQHMTIIKIGPWNIAISPWLSIRRQWNKSSENPECFTSVTWSIFSHKTLDFSSVVTALLFFLLFLLNFNHLTLLTFFLSFFFIHEISPIPPDSVWALFLSSDECQKLKESLDSGPWDLKKISLSEIKKIDFHSF